MFKSIPSLYHQDSSGTMRPLSIEEEEDWEEEDFEDEEWEDE